MHTRTRLFATRQLLHVAEALGGWHGDVTHAVQERLLGVDVRQFSQSVVRVHTAINAPVRSATRLIGVL